jgi:hypothetical protein
MSNKRSAFRIKATAVALVALTAGFSAAPALADGWHGGGRGHGWGNERSYGGGQHYDRGYRDHGYRDRGDRDRGGNDAATAALVIGGLLLGAAVLSQPPAYYSAPPQTVYAPAPSAYYGQAPIDAVPASDVYQTQSGQYCREYQSSVRVNGRLQNGYGTACLGEDGDWRVMN